LRGLRLPWAKIFRAEVAQSSYPAHEKKEKHASRAAVPRVTPSTVNAPNGLAARRAHAGGLAIASMAPAEESEAEVGAGKP
jgi:hypothetical protein